MKLNIKASSFEDIEKLEKSVLPVLIEGLPLVFELAKRIGRYYSLFVLYDAHQKKVVKVFFDKSSRIDELPENVNHVLFTLFTFYDDIESIEKTSRILQKNFASKLFDSINLELLTGALRENYKNRRAFHVKNQN